MLNNISIVVLALCVQNVFLSTNSTETRIRVCKGIDMNYTHINTTLSFAEYVDSLGVKENNTKQVFLRKFLTTKSTKGIVSFIFQFIPYIIMLFIGMVVFICKQNTFTLLFTWSMFI